MSAQNSDPESGWFRPARLFKPAGTISFKAVMCNHGAFFGKPVDMCCLFFKKAQRYKKREIGVNMAGCLDYLFFIQKSVLSLDKCKIEESHGIEP